MKKFLSLLFALLMCVTMFALPANAAEAGTLTSNAIVLEDNVWHTKYWTEENNDLNCYNKITVPEKGYITLNTTKLNDEGEMLSYYFHLYDKNGNLVWSTDTYSQEDGFNQYYTYKIGLNKGVYYLNIEADFYVYRGTIVSKYKYKFTANDCWEIEPNDDASNATILSLGKTYTGVYCDQGYDTPYKDYYKIYLSKNQSYKLNIYNYNQLTKGTTLIDFYDPKGEDIYISEYNGKDDGNSKCWNFTAKIGGWYTLLLWNDGCDEGVEYKIKFSNVHSSHTYKTTTTKATTSKDGSKVTKCTVCGAVKSKTTIYKISTVELSKTSYTYNGKTKTPTVTVKDSKGKTLKKDTDYTVTYEKGRKNVGQYTVTVKFKGNYSGTKKLTFKIVPKGTSLSSLSSGKKSFTVKWTKQTTQTTGYQIQYSTSSKMKSAKTVTVSKNSTTSQKISSLKTGTTYYVRIRTYKIVKVDGKSVKLYSSWSAVKNVKVK